MSPAERQRRRRALLARETTTPPVNQVLVGHAREVTASRPSKSVDLIVTSPPYWNAVTYEERVPWGSYERYLACLRPVWVECARVLRPAGKLCINAPLLPVEQKLMKQDTRVLKDIAGDIGRGILAGTDLRLCDQFVWQKQTTERMSSPRSMPRSM
jgi:DNA modification methylase